MNGNIVLLKINCLAYGAIRRHVTLKIIAKHYAGVGALCSNFSPFPPPVQTRYLHGLTTQRFYLPSTIQAKATTTSSKQH